MPSDSMITDFIKRANLNLTVEHVKNQCAMPGHQIFENDDGFLCYTIVQGNFLIIFTYVKPGGDILPFRTFVESTAKSKYCTKITFGATRGEAMARLLPDAEIVFYNFEKKLVY